MEQREKLGAADHVVEIGLLLFLLGYAMLGFMWWAMPGDFQKILAVLREVAQWEIK